MIHRNGRPKTLFPFREIYIYTLLITAMIGCTDPPPLQPPVTELPDTTAVIAPVHDSTSHNYTWRTWLMGDTPSSYWLGVSAITDDLAYAVGSTTVRKDTGKGYIQRNAMKWDGKEWSYFTVMMQYLCNSQHGPGIDSVRTDAGALYSVWGEAPNNWTFSYGGPIYYDGKSFANDFFFWGRPDTVGARHMFGNERDRWFFGVSGGITHGRGREYTLQPKITHEYIRGMAGNEREAWAVTLSGPFGIVLHYKNGVWSREDDHIAAHLNATEAVWCDDIGAAPGGSVVMVGSAIVVYDTTRGNIMDWDTVTRARPGVPQLVPWPRYFRCVHGSGGNNIWAAGERGVVVHYNGRSWRAYPELSVASGTWYNSVWATKNRVFLVGQKGTQAIITMGTRVD